MDYLSNPNLNINIQKKLTLLLTCAKGLEYIVLDEIKSLYPELIVKEIIRGKLLVELSVSLAQLFHLKCVDNIYLFIYTFLQSKLFIFSFPVNVISPVS